MIDDHKDLLVASRGGLPQLGAERTRAVAQQLVQIAAVLTRR